MSRIRIAIASAAILLGFNACSIPTLNVKFVEPKISAFKGHGNRVIVGEGSLVGDVLAIEVLKNGKFAIAGHELPASDAKAEAPAAAPQAPAAAEAGEAAAPSPAPAPAATSDGSFDYVFSVNTNTKTYTPGTNSYPATYSFAVTAKSGEIVYIKALSGGDLKVELANTITELAGLLL